MCNNFSPFAGHPVTGKWPEGEASVLEAGLVESNVVSVDENDDVIEALYKMHINAISSVAIKQGTKVFPHNFMVNAEDLRGY